MCVTNSGPVLHRTGPDFFHHLGEYPLNTVAPGSGTVLYSFNAKKPLIPASSMKLVTAAAALDPGRSILHTHRTFHFQAPEAQLNPIAKAVLGVSIDQIKTGLAR
jgi:D-alanyl-D-alanine carboxypeptidase